ncbi:hypothetical protein TNCV_850771 [Trichonephila clavipes]|nr:hypothetical protein TNCV_850771 [Trichonephila clavipes]
MRRSTKLNFHASRVLHGYWTSGGGLVGGASRHGTGLLRFSWFGIQRGENLPIACGKIIPPAAPLDQLWQRVEATRSAIPQEHIQSLFESMLRRVAAVISSNGDYSGY